MQRTHNIFMIMCHQPFTSNKLNKFYLPIKFLLAIFMAHFRNLCVFGKFSIIIFLFLQNKHHTQQQTQRRPWSNPTWKSSPTCLSPPFPPKMRSLLARSLLPTLLQWLAKRELRKVRNDGCLLLFPAVVAARRYGRTHRSRRSRRSR